MRSVCNTLVLYACVQLVAPGTPFNWFSSAYAPDGWTHAERGKYLLTELIPLPPKPKEEPQPKAADEKKPSDSKVKEK